VIVLSSMARGVQLHSQRLFSEFVYSSKLTELFQSSIQND